jgi:hypothetical protein
MESTPIMRCPHCEQSGISPLRKAVLSPGIPAVCRTCGKTSSIGYSTWLTAMLPGSILMVAALLVNSPPIEWTLNGIGLLLMILIPLLFAPLRKST